MDRKAWIAVTLSVAGLIGWYFYVGKNYKPQPRPATAAAAATPAATPGVSSPAPTPGSVPTPAAEEAPVRTERVTAGLAEYEFRSGGGGIVSAALKRHHGENDQPVRLNFDGTLPIGAMGSVPGEAWGGFAMTGDPAAGQVAFERRDADGLVVAKRFVLPAEGSKDDPYLVRMEVTFRNDGAAEVKRDGYFIATGGAAPAHSTDWPHYTRFEWQHQGKRSSIDVNWFNASSVPLLGIPLRDARDLFSESKPDVTWASVASQYFCTIVTTEKSRGDSAWATRFDSKLTTHPIYGIQGGLGMPGFSLPPGGTLQEAFLIYTGPKELNRLRSLKGGQDAVMNFGMFGFVSEFLLWAMNGLHGIFHSYAAAIIVLTLLIKSALWPIQNKATNQMRQMAALSPKMTELREKHKDDPQKLNEEMMKLYREYGVNPFSGCLPMLIQIPIFFGFYSMLGVAIELRNSSFLWIADLSQPDTIWTIPGINFPINLLPIIMAGTMVWQMAITPKSGDAMQQRIFYFMPVIFLVFCYNYASGLALYWTTQNIFSIVQLYLTRNKPLPTLEKKSAVAKREADAARKRKKKRPGP